ncbi:hypothetical protein V8G54_009329 [Vigna mungo]|uniref:HAT C-terminal dimerisation domain-containing protein n=1 Tax=Vigna mungo TaxID=3915 RepID=A0AAQ3NWI8_VIGMU
MARDILYVPVSSVPPESVFDTKVKEMDQYRSSLLPETVEAIVCAMGEMGVNVSRCVVILQKGGEMGREIVVERAEAHGTATVMVMGTSTLNRESGKSTLNTGSRKGIRV